MLQTQVEVMGDGAPKQQSKTNIINTKILALKLNVPINGISRNAVHI